MNNEDKIFDLLEKIYIELQDVKKELKSEIKANRDSIGSLETQTRANTDSIGDLKSEIKDFREESNLKFDSLENKLDDLESKNADRHISMNKDIQEMKSDISRIELNTADNWKDIVRLKSVEQRKTK